MNVRGEIQVRLGEQASHVALGMEHLAEGATRSRPLAGEAYLVQWEGGREGGEGQGGQSIGGRASQGQGLTDRVRTWAFLLDCPHVAREATEDPVTQSAHHGLPPAPVMSPACLPTGHVLCPRARDTAGPAGGPGLG